MATSTSTRSILALAVVLLMPGRTPAQTPAAQSWQGWARCQLDVQGPGYVDQQIHTWTLAGGSPTVEGAFRVYPGTWSVVGGGSFERTLGTQTLTAQWATNVQGMSAPIAVWVRPDGRLSITARHAQLRSAGAVAGYQQQVIDGQPQPPALVASEAFESAFPTVDGSTLSGTSTPPVNGSIGFMQPGGSRGTAACTWQFTQGAAAPAPPPVVVARAVPVPGSAGPGTAARGGAPFPAGGGTAPGGAPARTGPVAEPVFALGMPLACSLRGPSADPLGPSFATPGTSVVRWQLMPGATGYSVSREGVGILTATPIAPTQYDFRTAGIPKGSKAVFTITAFYPGGCGNTSVTLTPETPAPELLIRMDEGPGVVNLFWKEKRGDITGVRITGFGLPPAGSSTTNCDRCGLSPYLEASGSLHLTGVTAGPHTWEVRAVWANGDETAPVAASANVP